MMARTIGRMWCYFMEESCQLVAEENMNWDISDILI